MSLEENKEIWDKLKNKKNIHQVPEGYFENLPQIIQARAVESTKVKQRASFVYSLKYALPVVVLMIVAFVAFYNGPTEDTLDPSGMLENASIEELVEFLNDSEVSTDDLLAEIDLTGIELEFDNESIDLLDDNNISEDELNGYLDDFDTSDDFL